MKELSLNILDIAQNSIAAHAGHIGIALIEDGNGILTMTVCDDGCGMSPETLRRVTDPFCTTRTTRKVGMGIPLLRLAAEQTGGSLAIESTSEDDDPIGHGTVLRATFDTRHIDMTPLGDVVPTLTALIQGHPEIDYVFEHDTPRFRVHLDTRELRAVLGGVSLDNIEVLHWIGDYLREQYGDKNNNSEVIKP